MKHITSAVCSACSRMKFVVQCENGHSFAFNQVVVHPNWSYDQTKGDAAKIFVVRPNIRPRPSVKGAIQINAIIWLDFYCPTKLVASVKRAQTFFLSTEIFKYFHRF